jgi:hypothetical protein
VCVCFNVPLCGILVSLSLIRVKSCSALLSVEVNERAWLRKGRIRKKVLNDFRGMVEQGNRLLKKHDTGDVGCVR